MENFCNIAYKEIAPSINLLIQKDSSLIYLSILVYISLLVIFIQISLFGIRSVILVHLLFTTLIWYISRKVAYLKHQGVINYLPKFMQEILLRKSLFDILCYI